MESNSVCNRTSDQSESHLLITSMITDRIGRHEVLLPINQNCNENWEKSNQWVLLNKTTLPFVFDWWRCMKTETLSSEAVLSHSLAITCLVPRLVLNHFRQRRDLGTNLRSVQSFLGRPKSSVLVDPSHGPLLKRNLPMFLARVTFKTPGYEAVL